MTENVNDYLSLLVAKGIFEITDKSWFYLAWNLSAISGIYPLVADTRKCFLHMISHAIASRKKKFPIGSNNAIFCLTLQWPNLWNLKILKGIMFCKDWISIQWIWMLKRLKIKEKIAFLLFASANPKSKDIQSKRKKTEEMEEKLINI